MEPFSFQLRSDFLAKAARVAVVSVPLAVLGRASALQCFASLLEAGVRRALGPG